MRREKYGSGTNGKLRGVRNLYGGSLSMKSVRTSRQRQETPQPAAKPVLLSPVPVAGAAQPGHRTAQTGGSGAGSAWRLPSGQLLTEYALRTCFTGPLLNRTPFERPLGGEGDPRENSRLDASSLISQELRNLQKALGGQQTQDGKAAPVRGRAVRRAASVEEPAAGASGKPRSRR